ncbi:galanin receptor type 1-like [Oculina patagonica]
MQRNETFPRFNWTSTSGAPPTTISVGAAITAQFQIPKYVLYGVILTLSILGNAAVVYVIFQSRRRIRKTSYVLLVLNLAICDAITPTISIPFDWVFEEHDFRWTLGVVLCKLLWPLQTMFSTSSSFTLAMICYDRYRAVVHPFKARRVTKTHIKHCIFAIHFTSCLFMIPYAIVLNLNEDDCDEHWPSPISSYRKAYTLVLFLIQYGIPLTIMVSLHSLALKTLFGQSRDLRQGSTRSNASQASLQFKISARKKVQNVHVTKMFVVIVMVFALSMFPNQVLWLWVDFGNGGENEYFAIISAVCRLFTYSNSVLNPIIYGFYSREFRSGKTKLKNTTSAGGNPGIHTSGYNYAANRAVNGADKAGRSKGSGKDLLNHCLPAGTKNESEIHYKENSDTAGEQILSPSFLAGTIKNSSVVFKRHLQQNTAVQNPIKPSENGTAAKNDVLSSQLCPLKKSKMEGKDHVFSIPEYALRHLDDIPESRC